MGRNLTAVRNFMGILCRWIRKNQVASMMPLCAENVADLDHNFPSFFIIHTVKSNLTQLTIPQKIYKFK